MSLLYEWLDNAAGARRETAAGGGQALIYRDTYLSWHGLRHRVNRRASELKGLGIEAGDWVGLMLGSVPEFVVLALALSKLDAVVVPLDPTLGGRDLDMIFAATHLRALVMRPNTQTPFAATADTMPTDRTRKRPFAVLESRRRITGTLLTCATFQRTPLTLHARPEVVLFTLDAGGDPKGVVRERRQLDGIGAALAATLKIDGTTRVSTAAGLHTSQGFDLGLCLALAQGAGLVLDDELVAARLAKLLAEQSADVLAATPSLFAAMARMPTAKPCPSRRTRCISSGEPLTPAVALAFRKRFKVPLLSCYQAMETGPVTIDWEGQNPTTVGRPFAGVEIRVADRLGSPIPAGARGPVWVRGAGVSSAFVPPVSLRTRDREIPIGRCHSDGWLRTGDIGSVDANGRLILHGREDDLVKVDGRRVALGEVEGCLEAFANVRTAEARLEYDEAGGSRVIARVQRDGPCTPKQLIDHCARHLAPHKVPARVEFGEG
ncbi:MAG: class I adenylate-forming enzyme family protein [Polyangia bacterium]|jgi:acyl-CoA synthetase (AMP-forming)/AMP-acid ligase II